MKYLLVYDSYCGSCTRFKEIISFLDTNFVYSVIARRHDSGTCTQVGAEASSMSISTSRRKKVGALGPACGPEDGAHGPL